MELTVPTSMAGVTGPCPGCGQTLAAPAALPQFAPSFTQQHSEPQDEPPLRTAASSSSATGYRRPTSTPPPLPKPAPEDYLMRGLTEAWCILPLMMIKHPCGASRWVTFIYSFVIVVINHKILFRMGRNAGHYFATGLFSIFAAWLWLVVIAPSNQAVKDAEEEVQLRAMMAYTRQEMASRAPGRFTTEDFEAAETATLDAARRGQLGQSQLYLKVLVQHEQLRHIR